MRRDLLGQKMEEEKREGSGSVPLTNGSGLLFSISYLFLCAAGECAARSAGSEDGGGERTVPPGERRAHQVFKKIISKNVREIYRRFFAKFGKYLKFLINIFAVTFSSVADPDPGSGAFLTPGSGIRNRFISDAECRILNTYF